MAFVEAFCCAIFQATSHMLVHLPNTQSLFNHSINGQLPQINQTLENCAGQRDKLLWKVMTECQYGDCREYGVWR